MSFELSFGFLSDVRIPSWAGLCQSWYDLCLIKNIFIILPYLIICLVFSNVNEFLSEWSGMPPSKDGLSFALDETGMPVAFTSSAESSQL